MDRKQKLIMIVLIVGLLVSVAIWSWGYYVSKTSVNPDFFVQDEYHGPGHTRIQIGGWVTVVFALSSSFYAILIDVRKHKKTAKEESE